MLRFHHLDGRSETLPLLLTQHNSADKESSPVRPIPASLRIVESPNHSFEGYQAYDSKRTSVRR